LTSRKKSGFISKKSQPEDDPRPEEANPGDHPALILKQSTLVGFNRNRKDAPKKQEPALQHELSVEDKARGPVRWGSGTPKRESIKLSLLHAQHPMEFLYDLKKRLQWYKDGTQTMPSMTNYSNMDAPTPMKPVDRPV
jgi:hypothetical protein